MPIYRVGRFRFNTAFLISTEDRAGEPPVPMRVTMFPGEKYDLAEPDADDFGRKLDALDIEADGPIVGGAALASFDPESGRPLVRPGVQDVPGRGPG